MGTNFYLRKELSQAEKEKAKQFIEEGNYDSLKELLPENIHIGKRSGGWKFLWDAHYFEYYKPTKESLFEWLKSGQIINEYDEKFTFEQFINEELNGFLNKGYDLKSYYEDNPHECYLRDYFTSRIDNFQKRCPKFKKPINKYGEFYIEGLRFTVSEDFS